MVGFAASGPNTRTQQLCLFLGVLALKKGVLKVRFIHCLTRRVSKEQYRFLWSQNDGNFCVFFSDWWFPILGLDFHPLPQEYQDSKPTLKVTSPLTIIVYAGCGFNLFSPGVWACFLFQVLKLAASLFDKYLSYLGLLLQDSAGVNLCQSRYVLLRLSIFFARLDRLVIVFFRAPQLISTWRAGLLHASIVPWQISTPMCDSWSWYRPSSCRWCPFLGKEFHGDTHWPSGRGVAWNAAQDFFARRHPTMQRWGYSGGSTLWM